MTERDALLAAIRATPDDDTPRLVFADWLDENEPDPKPKKGMSPSSWAALIRAECELARLRDDGSAAAALHHFFTEKDDQSLKGVRWDRVDPEVGRRIELRKLADRARGPSKKARNTGRPKGFVGGHWDEGTHRGFPDGMHLGDGERLLAALPALTEYCPPVSATAFALTPGPSGRDLAEGGLGRWCRELTIHLGPPENAGLFRAMVAHPDAAQLRGLTVGLTDDASDANRALTALADSRHLTGLRALTLTTSAAVPPELVTRLARSKLMRGLTRLHLSGPVSEAALQMADVGNCPTLRTLALSESNLSDDDAILLAAAPGLAGLRHLDLQDNRIGGAGASALLASPHLANLAVLDLDYNQVRGLDRAALASAPKGGLRVLAFHGSRLTANDITALTASPRLADLMYFDADDNQLAASAIPRLVRGFGDRPPAVLYIAQSELNEAAVEALTNWPAAERIDMLHLIESRMTTSAAKAIACCPHLKGLNHLCATPVHPAGRTALKKRFGPRALV